MAKQKTWCTSLIEFFHVIVDYILEFILGWYWGPCKPIKIPLENAGKEHIVSKSVVELARSIRKRELTAEEVVRTYIDRMKALNPQLNAIMDGPFLEAIKEAIEIDRKLDNGEYSEKELNEKPFLGVPFTTKDSTAVKGKLQTLGIVSRKNIRATEDAECVHLIKKNGAIIIATSSVPEVNMWCETRNNIIGQTRNPYDLRRSTGGSSGGEAALIASSCTAFGLGTDIGGSIRIPSFACGIFGHKPTVKIINTRGCTFRTGNEEQTMVVVGPMTRHSTDLMPLLKVLARPEVADKLQLNAPVDIKKLRYFYILTNNSKLCSPVNRENQKMMLQIRRHFKKVTGNDVTLIDLPGLEYSNNLWRYWMSQEPADFSKLLGNGINLNVFVELIKKIMGKSDFTLAAIYTLINNIAPPEKEEKMRQLTLKMKRTLKDILGDDGVLFYPSSPKTIPFHYYPLLKPFDIIYFSIFNVLHMPVTQVPMGLGMKGVPLGVQVAANEMNDRLCIAVAEEMERAFGGWIPPYRTA